LQAVTARLTEHLEPGETRFTGEPANEVRRAEAATRRGDGPGDPG
jgi:hypothetical protein